MTLRTLEVALVLFVASLSATSAQSPAPQLPTIVMDDQFDRRQDLVALRGDVVVLIYGDRKSTDANKQLGELLHVHFHPTARGLPPAQAQQASVKPVEGQPIGGRTPNVHAIPIACIGKVPALVKKLIVAQFRKASPDVPVWLDFEDQMRREFDFTPGVPNVAVFDGQGRYRHRVSGAMTQLEVERLVGVIEAMRKGELQPVPK